MRMLSSRGPSPDFYEFCTSVEGEDASMKDLLRCISHQFVSLSDSSVKRKATTSSDQDDEFTRTLFLILCAVLAFVMQAGFAMICAGSVRMKNVQNAMIKNLLDSCGAAVAFFALGYAFTYGGDDPNSPNKTFIGTTNFFLMDSNRYAFFIFQFAFSASCVTIVAGALAERCQMAAYLLYSIVMTGWIYPVVAHSVWSPNGLLSARSVQPLWGVGMVDFAGSGVVHFTGGTAALFAIWILGPRQGRFHDDAGEPLQNPTSFPGHSPALQMLGTFILWFGWYGFNCGSALTTSKTDPYEVAALAGVNTTLAAAIGGITSLLFNLFLLDRFVGEPYFDLKCAMNGTIIGLVSINAGCGVFEPWAALVTGFISGFIYVLGSRALVRLKIDDAVDAVPVHMIGGAWGVLAVGLFASPQKLSVVYENDQFPGLIYTWLNGGSSARLLGVQLVGLLFIFGWVLCLMVPFFVFLDWKGWFRSDPLEEIVGLDTSYHSGFFLKTSDCDVVTTEALEKLQRKRLDHRRSPLSTASPGTEMDESLADSHQPIPP